MPASFLPEHPPIPGYEPVRLLGRNGAIVYLARRSDTGELVALKVYDRRGPLADVRRQEATLARLNHPNILRVITIGKCEGRPYTALEYVARDVAKWLRDGPLPAVQACLIARMLVAALHHGRDQGMTHLSLRPSAVALTDENVLKLLDFEPIASVQEWELTQRVTRLIGHPPVFAAPEELTGHDRTSPGIDMYRIGAVLYAMLTGQPPFSGDLVAIWKAVRERPPVRPRQLNPAVSKEAEAICLKCLDKRPERRYASLRHLAESLDHIVRFPGR
jgi:serine/threonine-protein kinase